MKHRPALAAALLLPVVGLAASWAVKHHAAQQGIDWEVPIAAYDPRDLLRGHYLAYRFEWPGITHAGAESLASAQALCIEGTPPRIARVSRLDTVPARDRCVSIARATDAGARNLIEGRFYVPQTRAADYEEQLRDPGRQGVVRVRIRADGVVTPKSLRFQSTAASGRTPVS